MDPSVWMLIAAAISGALVGFLLTVFGGGGSVLATPLLLYFVGVRDPHIAIGTSAAAVSLNAAAGVIGHTRAGRVKWPCALTFAAAGLGGTFLGSSLAKMVDGQRLLLFFAFAMAAVALSMLRPNAGEGDPAVRLNRSMLLKLAAIALIVGFAAGFFGIGGGFLIAPGLMAATGMTLANATASSLVPVAVFGGGTAANYAVSGQVDWPVFFAMTAGGAGGILAGGPVARLLSTRAPVARKLFAGLILIVAAYVAWKAWGAL
ncbi:MAG: sulfite exporter TauE/SafE family protein [Caulobacteraceae bacterium]